MYQFKLAIRKMHNNIAITISIRLGKAVITEDDYSCIVTNTGIRDIMVLYCQIENNDDTRKIIDYCVTVIADNEDKISDTLNEETVKLVNAVNYLVDSFCYRKELLREQDIELVSRLRNHLDKNTNYHCYGYSE